MSNSDKATKRDKLIATVAGVLIQRYEASTKVDWASFEIAFDEALQSLGEEFNKQVSEYHTVRLKTAVYNYVSGHLGW